MSLSATIAAWPRTVRVEAVALALGLAALYVPTVLDLARGPWRTDTQSHGPVVLLIGLWLLWRRWPRGPQAPAIQPGATVHWVWVVMAGLAYAFGRSQGVLTLEVGSMVLLLIGLVMLQRGATYLRALWFPLLFLCFMVPLPGPLVDALTQPMKAGVSWCAEQILFAVGYPIARTGVTLQVGPYQLLVADACAGLHTLFTLEAMGLLYLNLFSSPSMARNVTLALLIVPISFAANVIRVMVLTLVTFHLGDEAGQGFLHGFAGIVLFVSALLLIMAVDGLLRVGVRRAA